MEKKSIQSSLFVQKRSDITSLKQPKELGFYSKTHENEFLINDDSKLSYYYFPDSDLNKNLDLSSGINKFKECNTSNVDPLTLDGLLSTLVSYENRKGKKVKADIITFRGIIKKLILSAFDNPKYNKVDLRIASFDGQLFIKEAPGSVKTFDSGSRSSFEYHSYYTGYKFESLTTLSKPLPLISRSTLEKRPKKIVNNGDQYISVVKTGVGKCKLILGAEVDCIFDFREQGDNLKHYAELKCTKGVIDISDARKFERKLFKTWIQCFLIGINRIIYGFRDENFILRSVEEFATQEVPVLLKVHNPQVGNDCVEAIKWYGALTDWLLRVIPKEESEIKVYRLVFENNHLNLSSIDEDHPEYSHLVHGEAILSNSFKEWRKTGIFT